MGGRGETKRPTQSTEQYRGSHGNGGITQLTLLNIGARTKGGHMCLPVTLLIFDQNKGSSSLGGGHC